jgi:hypothetical protein
VEEKRKRTNEGRGGGKNKREKKTGWKSPRRRVRGEGWMSEPMGWINNYYS